MKIHDLTEMKEIYAIITLEDAGGLELITIFFFIVIDFAKFPGNVM